MKESHEKALFHRFSFFRKERPITESLMAFGFECEDGWFDIVWNLSEKIAEELDRIKSEMSKKDKTISLLQIGEEIGFEVVQVKEKFGTLRFYTNYSNDAIEGFIREAEQQSAKVCEICGAPATLAERSGWYKTLCYECCVKNKYDAIQIKGTVQ
jgi:hypothetical protein